MTALSLRGGRLWDGLTSESRPADVAVSGGLVAEQPEAGVRVLEISGCTIVPGLIEAHTHLCFNAGSDWREVYDRESGEQLLLRMAGNAQAMLRAGITTVRDLGAPTAQAVALRNAIREGTLTGPDLLVAGAPITPTGGHCWFLGGEADGVLGVQVAVRERRRAGVDWIKVMASGGNMTPGSNVHEPQFSPEEMAALVSEARRLGLPVTAHAHGVRGITAAVAGGVDMIEHCSFQTEDGPVHDDGVIAEIARRGIAVSPTITGAFVNYRGQRRWEQRAALTRAVLDAGCPILMSTDSGIPATPHAQLARSLQVISELVDLAPVDTLKLATSRSAELLSLPDRGTVARGQRADLLVVEGDPTGDLESLERVRLVVAGGRLLDRAA